MKERAGGTRRLPASAWLFDSGLALVAAGLSTAFFVELVGKGVPRGTLVLGYGLVLLHTLPLAVRRRFPGTVLGIGVDSGLAFAALGLPPVVLGVAILVAVYSVAAYGSRWVSLAGLATAELASAAVQLTRAGSRRPRSPAMRWSLVPHGCWATSWGSAAPTPPSWSGPLSWSGPERSWPAGRWPRSGCAWPASCMTWSPTASA